MNCAVGPTGIYPYEDVTSHVVATGGGSGFPEMMLFRGPNYIIGFGIDDKVYTLADGSATWVATEITSTLVDPDDISETLTLDCDTNIWHFAAFQQGWIACNGVQALYSVNDDDGAGTQRVYLDTTTYPLSVCSFRGRVFYGGMARHWLRFNANGLSTDMFGQALPAMTDGWVGWCTIQGTDILQHAFPERAISHGVERVQTELATNGDFSSGETGWTRGTGWTYAGGTPAMVGTATSDTLELAYAPSNALNGMYRFEVDLTVTTGYVTFSVTTVVAGDSIEYKGDLTLDASGNHVIYFNMSAPNANLELTLTGSSGPAFTGTVLGFSLKESPHFGEFESWHKQQGLLQSGFAPPADQGNVLCVLPLHEAVVAYGENFITAYSPSSSPTPTFGKVPLASFGICGRGAVGGSLDMHTFVDTSGKVWRLTRQLELQEVGYEEYFQNAVDPGGASPVMVQYDENEQKTYISYSDATYTDGFTYLLTAQGLSAIDGQVVHCLTGTRESTAYADTTGFVKDGTNDSFRLLTDEFDLELPGLKTIKAISVYADEPIAITCRLQYKATQSDEFMYGEAIGLDGRGEVYPEQVGTSFRIELTAGGSTPIRIFGMTVSFEVSGVTSVKSISLRR